MKEPEPIVLVVDDDDSLCRGVERLLRSIGLNVETFASAQAFMRRPPPEGPACLVLDMRMPGQDGLSVLRTIKQKWPESEVVVITGYPSIETAKEAIRLGAYDYLAKPVEPDDVIRVASCAGTERITKSEP